MKTVTRAIWVLSFLGLIIVIFLGSAYFISKSTQGEVNIIKKVKDFFVGENVEENIEDITSPDVVKGESGGGGSSGGDGGSGSDGGDGTINPGEPECPKEPLSYSILDINKISTCNQNQSDICLDKTITCSAEIDNRDLMESGIFGVELSFIPEGTSRENALEIKKIDVLIEPSQNYFFMETIEIQSSGEEGEANKRIQCFFSVPDVPQKCI